MGRGNAEDPGPADRRGGAALRVPAGGSRALVPRRLVWLWLLLAWVPIWALIAVLVLTAHRDADVRSAILIGLRMIATAALIALPMRRLAARFPWPQRFRLSFLAVHAVAAPLYALAWVLANSLVESLLHWRLVLVLGAGLGPFLVLGIWMYLIVAGVTYAIQATERAASAEAAAARAQLAALRAQLQPHFLFNALHTVLQLIPRDPARAAWATEQLAGLLRATVDEDRDLVPLAREWELVEQYLAIARIRFGERLRTELLASEEARDVAVPSFAVLTLVENALRHGAAPSVEPTDLAVTASVEHGALTVRVRDSGAGATPELLARGGGSGLSRLRERLAALYAGAARLDVETAPGRGFLATLHLPLEAP